jgi:hypothetical protein
MQTHEAKALSKCRGGIAERLNAEFHTHRGLHQVPVRGLTKVLTVVTGVALAHNVLRAMGIVPHLMT